MRLRPLPNSLNYAFKCKPHEESGPRGTTLSTEAPGARNPVLIPPPFGKGAVHPARGKGRSPRRSAAPHRHQPFTGFLEPGFGLRLARLTRGKARIKSRPLAPPPPAGAAMTRRPGTSAGALRRLRAHVIAGRCFTAAAPPLSYCGPAPVVLQRPRRGLPPSRLEPGARLLEEERGV